MGISKTLVSRVTGLNSCLWPARIDPSSFFLLRLLGFCSPASCSSNELFCQLLSKPGPHFFSTSHSSHIPFLCVALCACMPPLLSSSPWLGRDPLSRLPEHYTLMAVLHLHASHRHFYGVCHTPVFVNSESSNSEYNHEMNTVRIPILQMRKRRYHK